MTSALSITAFLKPGMLASILLFALCAGAAETTQQPQQGSAVSGQYPDLFAAQGYSAQAVNAKIQQAFTQLFYGDAATEAVYFPAGSNAAGAKAYILDINNNDVRSEGMSYGMMIAVQLNKQAEFNALWNWAKSHMYHADATHPAYGYFAWSVRSDGVALDEMPAPDGEIYFATALYFAAVRWGEGEGIYQYKAQADTLLKHMRHRQLITGNTQRGSQTGTNMFHPQYAMVRFTPDLPNADHTDASYHLPAFYEIWARVGPEADRSFWHKAAQVSRDYFSNAAHPQTGLTPDYGNFDGSPWAAPWRPEAADFRFDAWRSAMNWSFDWSWWRKDQRAVERSNRLQTFFASQGLNNYGGQYSLDGKKLDTDQNAGPTAGLVAMNAVASLAASNPHSADFVRALWQQPIPSGQYRYYDGMLYLLGLLHVSGQFQAWLPAAQAAKTE